MASQPASDPAQTDVLEIASFVRGVHAYKDKWEPRIGEVLCLQREPTNSQDQFAVAVMRSGSVVGHVPRNLAPIFSPFLKRGCNKAFVEITGQKVNRGAGHGVEAPCVYRLYGPIAYLQRTNELVTQATNN